MASRREQSVDRRILLVILFLVGALMAWMVGMALVGVVLAVHRERPHGGLMFSPSPLVFGAQPIGTRSRSRRLELRNTGEDPVSIQRIIATGDFKIDDGCVATRLKAREQCTVSVSFVPSFEGPRSGTIRVIATTPKRAWSVKLVGDGRSDHIRARESRNASREAQRRDTESRTVEPPEGAPRSDVPKHAVPRDEIPPGRSPPGAATRTEVPPHAARPDAAKPDVALPHRSPPDAAKPDVALPHRSPPDAALPDAALPHRSPPDAALPDGSVPDAALRAEAPPDAAPPDPDDRQRPHRGDVRQNIHSDDVRLRTRAVLDAGTPAPR